MARQDPAKRLRYLSRSECDRLVVGKAINQPPLFTATEAEMSAAIFAFAGQRETPAQTKARRERECGL